MNCNSLIQAVKGRFESSERLQKKSVIRCPRIDQSTRISSKQNSWIFESSRTKVHGI